MASACIKCNSVNVVCCGHEIESDGAAWTWVKWKHRCADCGDVVTREIQYPYDREEIEPCPLC